VGTYSGKKAGRRREIQIDMIPFTAILFYLFSLLTLVAAIAVVCSRNPVHSVLWLIFAFFNAAGLFILLGAEMLAMLLVIVYVGAVAVLFLFVVMMLNIKTTRPKTGLRSYLPVGLLLVTVLLIEIIMVLFSSMKHIDITHASVENAEKITNVEKIGRVLYTEHILYFQTAGLILLVAMIGAIVLTLRHREGVHRQKPSIQNNRRREDTLEMVKVEVGKVIE